MCVYLNHHKISEEYSLNVDNYNECSYFVFFHSVLQCLKTEEYGY